MTFYVIESELGGSNGPTREHLERVSSAFRARNQPSLIPCPSGLTDGPRSNQTARAAPDKADGHRWHKGWLVYLVVSRVNWAISEQNLPQATQPGRVRKKFETKYLRKIQKNLILVLVLDLVLP
jgi:hypothetical protein